MIIHQLRGPSLETSHEISAACWSNDGAALLGRPMNSPWRSCGKPFQLWACLEVLDDPELPLELLAVGAASHSGTDEQLVWVRTLLASLGVSEEALRCGATPPLDRQAYEAVLRRGEAPHDIHNDCSGKHGFMLAAAAALGAEGDYRSSEHPLQRRIVEVIQDFCQEAPELSVDGCGVPTFSLSLTAMARAFARLATDRHPRTQRIREAMQQHPQLLSGPGRLDLQLCLAAREPVIAKIGAGAVHGIALPGRGIGIATKCGSGDEDALGAALPVVLDRLAPGAFEWPEPWPWSLVRSKDGSVVGRREVTED